MMSRLSKDYPFVPMSKGPFFFANFVIRAYFSILYASIEGMIWSIFLVEWA